MKRSLILSVIMTVVLVVAMSTATYAWYNQSTSVTATMTNLTATSAVGYLRISADGGSTWGSSASIAGDASVQYRPATPLSNQVATASWLVGFRNADNLFELAAPVSGEVYVKSYQLVLKNEGQDDLTVCVSSAGYASISSSNADTALATQSVHAIYKADGSLLHTNGFNYGKVDDAEADGGAKAAGVVPVTNNTLTIASGASVTVNVYNWIDGWKATDEASGGSVKFNLNFAKA
ncbi:MAG: hypothetical protein ACI4M6_03295 [Christensenellaceae bacterium]